jgi:hypothetical protein
MQHAAVPAQLEPKIRPADEGDVAFLSSTWKQSFWRESTWANRIRWSVFEPGHAKVIQRLLARSLAIVACDPERETEIAGYLVYEPGAIHYAYVKPAFRRAGVLRALLAASGLPADLDAVAITHGTRTWFSAPPLVDKPTGKTLKAGRPGLEEKFPKAVHDPYRWMES